MIIVPGKFVFVGSPRSGSHFIHNALEKAFPDAIRTPEHHALIAEALMASRMNGGLPIYTIVRDPVEQIFSFYWNSLQKYPDRIVEDTFETFIRGRRPQNVPYNKATDYPPGDLSTYREVATQCFPFEKDFTTFFDFIGVDVKALNVQPLRTPPPEYYAARDQISESDRLLVHRLFKKDLELWTRTNDSRRR